MDMDIEEGKEEESKWSRSEYEGDEEEKTNCDEDNKVETKAETLFRDGREALSKLTLGLRRRRFRRTPAKDIEEGKSDNDSYSPRDKKPAPSPRHITEAKLCGDSSAGDASSVVNVGRRVSSPSQPFEETKEARPCLPASSRLVTSSFMISDPEKKIRERYSRLRMSAAEKVPEIHVIGEVEEGVGFPSSFISVKFSFEWGVSLSLYSLCHCSNSLCADAHNRIIDTV